VSERVYYEIPLSEWQEMDWWPTGQETLVLAGHAGHDREITVTIDGFDYDNPIPKHFEFILKDHLPLTWYVENRGTRIELHPSGSFAGGYDLPDLDTTKQALEALGLRVTKVEDLAGE
jgi:hypothetical protein